MTRLAASCCIAAFAVAALPLASGCDELPSPDFERMLVTRHARAYQATEHFADGRVMRPLVEGTVPRESLVGDDALTRGATRDASGALHEVTRSPVPVTRALLVRGRDRFEIYCAACHGIRGDGVSEVARNMVLRPPPSLVAPPVTGFSPGRTFRVVSEGYGLMPSWASVLSVEDRWAVVAYLDALRLAEGTRLDQLPDDVRRQAPRELTSP